MATTEDGHEFRIALINGFLESFSENAKLLLAAPELLAALILLREAEWGDGSDILRRRKIADEAIAKAEASK